MRKPFRMGDWVIYRMPKTSVHPGPRAREIHPAERGDTYSYVVDKFWIVAEVRPGGTLLLKTRRGKEHFVDQDSPLLRHAQWWERGWYRDRFPSITLVNEESNEKSGGTTGE